MTSIVSKLVSFFGYVFLDLKKFNVKVYENTDVGIKTRVILELGTIFRGLAQKNTYI